MQLQEKRVSTKATILWRYRLEVRQSVPILIGLASVLVLLLSQGSYNFV